ncbi:SAVED domain-containing protein [Psychromonas sp. PT13]|uniref:SAVED domain-containing protein n=1 Tax=Psychromonas sp. PT13 TaxID=3439547 RepID=UPI003EB72589
MKLVNVLMDIVYVILQRRLSSARYLIKTGLILLSLGIPSLIFSFTYQDYSFLVDTANSPTPVILSNLIGWLGAITILFGIILEGYTHFYGEAQAKKRAKSIDLRSLNGAAAPTLSDSFEQTIETAGINHDLFLWKDEDESQTQWLKESVSIFNNFAKVNLARMNSFEPQKPLALGAIAHVPHCFVLGFLVGNKRLTQFYCWNRNTDKADKNRWLDCRDKRSRGQSLHKPVTIIMNDSINDTGVKKVGLSIEISDSSDVNLFKQKLDLDVVAKLEVPNKYIGNMFSEREQVAFVTQVREFINSEVNTRYPNVEEVHITILAQCSLVMRIGAEFNQNHIPNKVFIYHFNRTRYEWCFYMSPNSRKINFKEL